MVAAGILPLKGEYMARLNRPGENGRTHAEHAVIEDFIKKYGSIPEGSVCITTLSPCNTPMDERDGPSCEDMLNEHGIQKVYCVYIDPTQHDGAEDNREYNLVETQNKEIRSRCEKFADTFLDKITESFDAVMFKHPHRVDRWNPRIQFNWNSTLGRSFVAFNKHGDKWVPVDDESERYIDIFHKELEKLKENFADGKNPQDKGDSKRYHVPTKGSVSSLRKFAKGHSGRAAQLAHWMANMKSGHKK
jgi:pyrimidine deaminase RibD-like protein